jgi:hypothetical protein
MGQYSRYAAHMTSSSGLPSMVASTANLYSLLSLLKHPSAGFPLSCLNKEAEPNLAGESVFKRPSDLTVFLHTRWRIYYHLPVTPLGDLLHGNSNPPGC